MSRVVGVGVDAVPVARMRRALERTPRITERVFTPGELAAASGRSSAEESLAARFAAKEACRKVLGEPVSWRDIEVVSDSRRRPSIRVAGYRDVRFHVSLTHTAELAFAVVVGESV